MPCACPSRVMTSFFASTYTSPAASVNAKATDSSTTIGTNGLR